MIFLRCQYLFQKSKILTKLEEEKKNFLISPLTKEHVDIHVYPREEIMLAIRLPSEIENRLASLAAKTGRTKTYYARKAILDFIEDMEDTYLALERLENPQQIWKQEELEAKLDLDN